MIEGHLDMNLRQWIRKYQKLIVGEQITYRGVTTLKNVLDLWIYQEIVHETRPDVVIEIGTRYGGSALWLADLLGVVGHGRVVTIDIAHPGVEFPERIRFVHGNSVDPAVVTAVAADCAGARAMVIADGDHSAAHVREELEAYCSFVAPGCYYVVEDAIVDVMGWKHLVPGPGPAVADFLAAHDEFTADRDREKFILTYNPGSFLRRTR